MEMELVVLEIRLVLNQVIEEPRVAHSLVQHLQYFNEDVVRKVLIDVVLDLVLSLPDVTHESTLG